MPYNFPPVYSQTLALK
uniref:Uncharacterized protein n=1 Tax=Lepeophtheirus salmonis TaxID=72036 RepID=A0A0K2TEE3_LEPSM